MAAAAAHIATRLLFSCWGNLFKKPKALCCFRVDWDEIWQDCSSNKYTSTNGVGFLIWRPHFQDGGYDVTHAEKCCRLLSAHAYAAESVGRLPYSNSVNSSW